MPDFDSMMEEVINSDEPFAEKISRIEKVQWLKRNWFNDLIASVSWWILKIWLSFLCILFLWFLIFFFPRKDWETLAKIVSWAVNAYFENK